MMRFAIALLTLALGVQAAVPDGQWAVQTVPRGKKNTARTVAFTLDLRSRDGQVTGSVVMPGARRPRSLSIQNARLNGDTLTFTTHTATRKSDTVFFWTARFDGDQVTGSRVRDGAKGGQPFAGKRVK